MTHSVAHLGQPSLSALAEPLYEDGPRDKLAINASSAGPIVQPSDSDATPLIELGVTPRRFAVLAIYIAFGLSNQLQYVGNANIVDQLTEYLDCSKLEVNMLATIFALIYVIGAFPACEVFARMGLRLSLLVGLGCNGLGAVLKLIAVAPLKAFWLMALGQAFSGIGQIFFLALSPLLAATWFPTSERSLATALGSLSMFLGMALGSAVPPAIVNDTHHNQTAFAANYGSQAAFCCAVALAGLLFVPAHPEHPPSVTAPQYIAKVAGMRHETDTLVVPSSDAAAPTNVFSQLWSQRRNSGFIALTVALGLGSGGFTTLSTVQAQLLEPYHVSEQQSGRIMLAAMLLSCMSCMGCGPLLDRYRRYRTPLIWCFLCVAVLTTGLGLLMRFVAPTAANFVPICYVMFIVITVSLLPMVPIGLELAVELTYPLPEAVPATACMWSNGFFSLIGTVAASLIFGNKATRPEGQALIWAIDGLVVVCLGLVVFAVKEERHRYDAEQASGADHNDREEFEA